MTPLRIRKTSSTSSLLGALAATLAFTAAPSEAAACGGFFCSTQPVDQTAERIMFEVDANSVTMTTQIAFNGDSEDFAWILPLSEVPDPDSLAVFPQRALAALDANTGPLFYEPSECFNAYTTGFDGVNVTSSSSTTGGGGVAMDPEVTVHIRAEVGNYIAAVIESEDPDALVAWLLAEGYRVTPPMEPYIDLYTEQGMKFLALKLQKEADVSDIAPFRFTLPGTTPSIPLRMTSIAAEPEMSIVTFVLSDQRFEAKNWDNIEIADDQILYDADSYTWPLTTNWGALVASGVDEAGGQGWVTEFAGSTLNYATLVRNQVDSGNFQTEEDEDAANQLVSILEAYPYITRLYTRLSAEEMTLDPILGRSAGEDVAREHYLERYVNGEDQCPGVATYDPCVFATCGAGGICRSVTATDDNGASAVLAACGCVPGATARTTFAPDGTTTVICQDQRMSFLNPGDQQDGAETLPDPCATFSCGEFGSCVAVNMTPTCVCDRGYVATGRLDTTGARLTTCMLPDEAIPDSFYDERLPELPDDMPGGIDVEVPEPTPGAAGDTSTTGEPATGGSGTASGSGGADAGGSGSGAEGGSGGDSATAARGKRSSGCSFSGPTGEASWLLLVPLALVLGRRRRSS